MPNAVGFLAAATTNVGGLNIAGITKLLGSLVGVAILAGGLGILIRVHSQRNFAAATGGVLCLLIGLAVVGLSLTNNFDGVATTLSNTIFSA